MNEYEAEEETKHQRREAIEAAVLEERKALFHALYVAIHRGEEDAAQSFEGSMRELEQARATALGCEVEN